MLSKFEPVVLAILALGASVLMENRHRIDLTSPDRPPARTTSAPAACQQDAAFTFATAMASEGEAVMMLLGNDSSGLADGCTARKFPDTTPR